MPKGDFSVARVEKRTRASVGKFERHIERKNESYENMNVDLSRTPLNVHFQGCGELTYNEHLDRLIADGTVSLKGLKADATVFNEMILDVNTDYFERNGGYDFACRFYEEAFHFAGKLYGKDNIISAVMHADELNIAMTEKYGKPIYHYHLHIMALPVVDKEVRWSKRCKDPALVGTVKEVIHQISHSKKWKSEKALDENGNPVLNSKGKPVYRASYPHALLATVVNNQNSPCAAAKKQSKFKYWEVTSMGKILPCEFNLDTACVELCLDDGTLLSIDCTAVENEVANSMYQRSELDWLIYNDPLSYAELILNGDPELYLKEVTKKTPLD